MAVQLMSLAMDGSLGTVAVWDDIETASARLEAKVRAWCEETKEGRIDAIQTEDLCHCCHGPLRGPG